MRLDLPLVVIHHSMRRIEALLPTLDLAASGPVLAALRDDLALEVMMRFERAGRDDFARYQMAPHARVRHVRIDATFRGGEHARKTEIAARVAVLCEKWPADDFWVITPIRLPRARFATPHLETVEAALARRLVAWCVEFDLESIDDLDEPDGARLEVLEVDADPPSILPRTTRSTRAPRARSPKNRKDAARAGADPEAAETPAEREERRGRARLQAATLREACRNLSHAADGDSLDRAFGREALVESVCAELLGREGAAIVLVGPPGCGKTAIVHEVVRRLHARHTASGLRRDVWRIDGGRFIAGQSFVGQWEARARKLCDELSDTADVLYADDLAALVYAGRTYSSGSNLARFIEPHLARGEITLVAESTPERLDRVREEAPSFAAHFRVIPVPPLDARSTLPVLLGVLRELEADESAGPPPRLEPAALETLLEAGERFRPHEALPGKAVRLLSRVLAQPGTITGPAGARVRLLTTGDVFRGLGAETGLPPFILGAEPPRPRDRVRRDLLAMVAGQPEAIDAITDVVLAMQAGLGDPEKPLATLLLVGPTGVGKTETAKALARYLFGSADRLLRFDMSEFASGASIARLVGEAGGAAGELTAALRAQPLRVILFDEIEKAHPRVFDALLQLLGEGRISDPSGRTADARQAVLLLTSNLGVREAASRPGFLAVDGGGGRGEKRDGGGARAHYLGAVRAFFRPEFFNRIDRVVPYVPLDKPALRIVVEHALMELLSRRGIQRGRVLVDVEPQLLDLLVEQAFDPRYGARPLRRALERRLTVPLAHHLATRRGDDLAFVELYRRGDELGLSVRLLADAPALPPPPALPRAVDRLVEAIAALGTEAARLGQSPAALRLAAARRQALAAGGSEVPGAELLDELAEIDAEVAALVALPEGDWADEVDEPTQEEINFRRGDRRTSAGRGGLRPRPTYREVALAADPEAVARALIEGLSLLADRLVLVAHRLAAASARPDDRLTLLFECIGVQRPAATVAARACMHAWSRDSLTEYLGPAGAIWQPTAEPPPGGDQPYREGRSALSFMGPGLRELLIPRTGWALIEVPHEGVLLTVPVRVELLDGEPRQAIAARDAAALTAREARRQQGVAGTAAGDAPAAGPDRANDVITLRGTLDAPLIHVASGAPGGQSVRIAAAVLRALAASAATEGAPRTDG